MSSSTMSVFLLHRKLLQNTITTNSSHYNLINTNNNNVLQWSTSSLDLVVHLLAYVAILAVFMVVLLLIIKLLGRFEYTSPEEFGPTETNPLRTEKTVAYNYGTILREDLEKGNCSSSSSSNNEDNISTCSSEELYDGKLCVICYDEQRDCFFVPCGHCATCYVCAQRIFNSESKTCPVCRRLIRKVRRLFAS